MSPALSLRGTPSRVAPHPSWAGRASVRHTEEARKRRSQYFWSSFPGSQSCWPEKTENSLPKREGAGARLVGADNVPQPGHLGPCCFQGSRDLGEQDTQGADWPRRGWGALTFRLQDGDLKTRRQLGAKSKPKLGKPDRGEDRGLQGSQKAKLRFPARGSCLDSWGWLGFTSALICSRHLYTLSAAIHHVDIPEGHSLERGDGLTDL